MIYHTYHSLHDRETKIILHGGYRTMSTQTVSTYAKAQVNSVIKRVYAWMFGGLLITALTALFTLSNQTLLSIITRGYTLLFLFIVEIGIVFYLSFRIQRMSLQAASTSFIVYSALNGITLAPLFLLYTSTSIVSTFFITAGVFGTLSVWAFSTKKDLSGWGQYLYIGLIGILIAGLVNLFLRSSAFEFLISVIGVVLFMGLTAYDTQIIAKWSSAVSEEDSHTQMVAKFAILGALKLYLDFINLFLFLLRILGRRR